MRYTRDPQAACPTPPPSASAGLDEGYDCCDDERLWPGYGGRERADTAECAERRTECRAERRAERRAECRAECRVTATPSPRRRRSLRPQRFLASSTDPLIQLPPTRLLAPCSLVITSNY